MDDDREVYIAPTPLTPESLATVKYVIESYLRHRRETEPDAKLVEFYTPSDDEPPSPAVFKDCSFGEAVSIKEAIISFFKDPETVDNGYVRLNDDGSIRVDAVFSIDDLVAAIEAALGPFPAGREE